MVRSTVKLDRTISKKMSVAQLTSKIDRAKVYAQGATITRIANLELVNGEIPERVEITGLPLALEDSSLRARIETESSETAAIATDIRIGLAVPELQERESIAEAEIRQAAATEKKLQNIIALIDAEIEAIAALKIADRPQRDPKKAPPPSPIAARLAIANFKAEQIKIKQKERRENKEKLRRAIEQLEDLQQKQKLASSAKEAKPNELRKTVIVSLTYAGETDNFSQQRLVIEYFVPGARWTPTYVCRLDSKTNTANIALRALICQNSGEDWLGVSLELSTALPQTWCELPELPSLRIGKAQPSLPVKTGWRQAPIGSQVLFEDYDLHKKIIANNLVKDRSILPPLSPVRVAPLLDLNIPYDLEELDAIPGGYGGTMMMPGVAYSVAAEPLEEKTEFDVYLTYVPQNKKIDILKEIRAITGLGLKESKELVESAPVLIKEAIPKEEAENLITRLKQVGAGAGFSLEEPVEEKTEFDVYLTYVRQERKIDILKEIRAITGLGLKESKELVESAPVLIKEAIPKEEAENLITRLKQVGAGAGFSLEEPEEKARGITIASPQKTPIDRLAYSLMRLSPADNTFKRGRLYFESVKEIYLQILERQKAIVSFDILDRVKQAINQATNNIQSLPPGSTDVRSQAGSFDYAYQAEGRIDLVSDKQYHSVAIASRDTNVNLRYVVVPRESTNVFRIAQLRNPLQAPLLAGAADIYVDGEYILGTRIKTIPTAGEMELGLGVEQAIKVARNTSYSETRSSDSLVALNQLHHQIKIDLVNRLNRQAKIEIRERIPIVDRNAKVDIEIDRVSPEWQEYNQEERQTIIKGGYRWQIDLSPQQETNLEVDYTIKTFIDKELIGGNRRE